MTRQSDLHPVRHVGLPRPVDRRDTDVKCFGNLLVGPGRPLGIGIGFEQQVSPLPLGRRAFTLIDHPLQSLSFRGAEMHEILDVASHYCPPFCKV